MCVVHCRVNRVNWDLRMPSLVCGGWKELGATQSNVHVVLKKVFVCKVV